METKELITVQQLPVIAEQLAALRADVLARTTAAVAMEATEETRKDIKAMRAALNKQYKELEDRRIAVKKEILKPYEAFEQIYRQQIGSLFTDADAQLSAKIRRVEAGMKHKLEQDARAYFAEYAAFRNVGPDALTWETCGVQIGLNDTPTKLRRAVQQKVDTVRGELDCIAAMEDADAVRAEWNLTHSLPAAVATVKARKAAIEAERIRREAEERAALQAQQEAEARAAALAEEAAQKPAAVVVQPVQPAQTPDVSGMFEEEDPAPEEGTPWLVEHFVSLCGTPDAIAALHDAAASLDIDWEELRSE